MSEDTLARAIHNAWTAEMRRRGYRQGPDDPANRTHPDLVIYDDLPPEAKEREEKIARALITLRRSASNDADIVELLAEGIHNEWPLASDPKKAVDRLLAGAFLIRYDAGDQLEPRAVASAAVTAAASFLGALSQDEQLLCSLVDASRRIAQILASGRRLIVLGNGGSMAAAMHFAGELAGRFRNDREPLDAVTPADPVFLTCVSNDMHFDDVFARFVAGAGRAGDGLLAISTSGQSENVRRALLAATDRGLATIALLGSASCPAAELAEWTIAPSVASDVARVQEAHAVILHSMTELIESELMID